MCSIHRSFLGWWGVEPGGFSTVLEDGKGRRSPGALVWVVQTWCWGLDGGSFILSSSPHIPLALGSLTQAPFPTSQSMGRKDLQRWGGIGGSTDCNPSPPHPSLL